ncbi:phage integrase SAM-like domain-containing protein [Fulvivirgaceae bacterium BMA10]|uniref:Phage integrase SAM-like domain-containing protein n=1 Tax=Splendidivirga corallicola TaxID=3051826 RepID=A0ABT8KHL6_9BACT|nr:phage integrase SAM-like domain-containing protein [Fulvivirgaceae bacterium BMA10]
MESFLTEYYSKLSKEDLNAYMESKAKQRYRDGEIEWSTYQAHLKTYRKLLHFKQVTLFHELDNNWANKFDAFLKKHIQSRDKTNSCWVHHKTVKAYLKLVRRDHIIKIG